jgi:2,4-dienoyl-CoA reductase-like NADH-dependent reductase (Old Yellow Enzyme family)
MIKQLLTPTQIGDLNLKNRVILAPMTRTRANPNGCPTELMAEYYGQRASAGLVVAEATGVDSSAIAWLNMPGIYNDEHVEGWKKTTQAVHQKDGKIFLQLWHPGRATHSLLINGQQPVAPSAIRLENNETHTPEGSKPYEIPRALELEEIPQIIAMFKKVQSLQRLPVSMVSKYTRPTDI